MVQIADDTVVMFKTVNRMADSEALNMRNGSKEFKIKYLGSHSKHLRRRNSNIPELGVRLRMGMNKALPHLLGSESLPPAVMVNLSHWSSVESVSVLVGVQTKFLKSLIS